MGSGGDVWSHLLLSFFCFLVLKEEEGSKLLASTFVPICRIASHEYQGTAVHQFSYRLSLFILNVHSRGTGRLDPVCISIGRDHPCLFSDFCGSWRSLLYPFRSCLASRAFITANFVVTWYLALPYAINTHTLGRAGTKTHTKRPLVLQQMFFCASPLHGNHCFLQ